MPGIVISKRIRSGLSLAEASTSAFSPLVATFVLNESLRTLDMIPILVGVSSTIRMVLRSDTDIGSLQRKLVALCDIGKAVKCSGEVEITHRLFQGIQVGVRKNAFSLARVQSMDECGSIVVHQQLLEMFQ